MRHTAFLELRRTLGHSMLRAGMAISMLWCLAPQAAILAVDSRPEPIQLLISHGFEVRKTFNAEAGLTGWVIRRAGRSAVVYTTPDKAHLIVGSLVDVRGQNLTAAYAELYGDKPDYDALYKRLDSARYIPEGAAQPKAILRVFFDPNCIFCHSAWKALKPFEQNGLQVHWIPVAFLKPTSVGRAAAILEAKRPIDAMKQNEQDFNEKTEDGGLKPLATPSSMTTASLAANRELMDSFGGNGTPLLVWKDKDGKVKFASGLPPTAEIAQIVSVGPNPSNGPK